MKQGLPGGSPATRSPANAVGYRASVDSWGTLIAVVCVFGLAGCSSPSQPPVPSAPAATRSSASSTVAPPQPSNWNGATAFTKAFVARDFNKARTYVAKGNAADRYLTHQRSMDQARAAAGQPVGKGGRVRVDPSAGTVSFTLDGAKVVWRDWRFDEQGRIEGWSIDLGLVTLPIQ